MSVSGWNSTNLGTTHCHQGPGECQRERQSIVNVIVVVAVIDDVVVSVPLSVTVYVPFAALPDGGALVDAPEQPPFTNPAATKIIAQPETRSARNSRLPISNSTIAISANPTCAHPSHEPGQPILRPPSGKSPAKNSFPPPSVIAAVPHADALVLIVSVGATGVALDTAVLGIEKHRSVEDGLLETAQEIVPV